MFSIQSTETILSPPHFNLSFSYNLPIEELDVVSPQSRSHLLQICGAVQHVLLSSVIPANWQLGPVTRSNSDLISLET